MPTTGSYTTWLRGQEPNPEARLRLFCFPYAGAGASVFHTWPQACPKWPSGVEVCRIELPGHETRLREAPFNRLTALVAVLGPALQPLLDRPFALFGHSMGALISFELARYWRQHQGLTPEHLFVSGRRAPQVPSSEPLLYRLPNTEFWNGMRERYQGMSEAVWQNADLKALFLPILRADVTLVETYEYRVEAALNCGITAFGGLQDTGVSEAALAAWREQTHGVFTQHMVAGDHFFLKADPTSILQVMSEELSVSA